MYFVADFLKKQRSLYHLFHSNTSKTLIRYFYSSKSLHSLATINNFLSLFFLHAHISFLGSFLYQVFYEKFSVSHPLLCRFIEVSSSSYLQNYISKSITGLNKKNNKPKGPLVIGSTLLRRHDLLLLFEGSYSKL